MEPHPWTPALTPPPPLPFSIMFLWDPGSMSWQPPELELLEIDELSDAKFSGIFKLTYDGDFFITLQTKVQVYFCRFLVFGGRPGGGDLGDASPEPEISELLRRQTQSTCHCQGEASWRRTRR